MIKKIMLFSCIAMMLASKVGIRIGSEIAFAGLNPSVSSGTSTSVYSVTEKKHQGIMTRIKSIKVPFVLSEGNGSERKVEYFANTFAGIVRVSDQGIAYHPRGSKRPGIDRTPIKETWLQAKSSELLGIKPAKSSINLFIGPDPTKWKRNVPCYEEIGINQIYDGISLTLKASNQNIEKVFTVQPGADPRKIAIRVDGIKSLRVNSDGELELKKGTEAVKLTRPVAYQEINGERLTVKATYTSLGKNIYGFKVEGYDPSRILVIDPWLASSFLGDTGSDFGYAIDGDGSSIYVVGWTNSTYFPTTDGVYGPFNNGGYDVFISKLQADLQDTPDSGGDGKTSTAVLEASTFLGGYLDDYGSVIAINGEDVYVAGSTKSSDFPIESGDSGVFDTGFNGTQDVFVCKLSKDLDELKASTYLGGSALEQVYAIKISEITTLNSSETLIYLAGTTQSRNFPVLSDTAFDIYYSGSYDVFVTAFDNNLRLRYQTLLGGVGSDIPYALDIKANKVFIAGSTQSADFPTTPRAYKRALTGAKPDAFIAQFDYTLGYLQGSTYLGGSTDDCAYGLLADGNDTAVHNIFVTGYTNSVNFPVNTQYSAGKKLKGKEDVFVAKLSGDLSGKCTDSSTYAAVLLGGTSSDYGRAMKFDSHGNLVIAGTTKSNPFPTTNGAYDTSYNGGLDAFVLVLDPNLGSNCLSQATYLGGKSDDQILGLFVDSNDSIYVTGTTKSIDFPSGVKDGQEATYQPNIGGKEDVFITIFSDGSLSAE